MTRTSVGYPANPLQEGYHALRLATGSLDEAVYTWRLAVRGEVDAGRLEAAAAAALAEVQALHEWPDLQPRPDPPGLGGRPAVAAVRAVPGGADVDLTIHHLAADGAAIGALCELIGARYRDPGVRAVVPAAALTGALDGLVLDRADADLAYWAARWTRVSRPAAGAEPRPGGYHVASVPVDGERLGRTARGRRTPLTGLLIGATADAVEHLLGTPLPALMVSIDLRPHLPFPPTDARAIGFAINSVVVPAVHLGDGAGLRDAVAGLLDHGLTPMPVLTARYAREQGRAAPAAPWLVQVVSEPVPTLALPGATSTSALSGTAAYGRAGLVTLVVGERPRIDLAVAGAEPAVADRLAALVAELVQGADAPVAATAATGPARAASRPESAPADPAVAEAVRDGWRAVLHLTALPPDAHFLALGGTSVAAVALSHRLATRSGLDLSPDQALSTPRLVDHIGFARPRRRGAGSPAAPGTSTTGPVPMPAVMYRYMKHDRNGVFNTEYNLNYAWRIEGPVDAGALAAAAGACARRHEALRLRYFRAGGEWRVYAAEVEDPLQITRLAAGAYEDDETVHALVGAEQARPFEPHRPLIRLALWSEPAGRRHLFSITVPHMVFDGWSKNILLSDLVAFYADGPGARRPEVHGWWEYRADQLARIDAGLDAFRYWVRQLRDARPLLDLDESTRAAVQRGLPTATLGAELGPGYERRRQTSAAAGVTPELATLTAVVGALSRVFDTDDVLVGLPAANRDDARWAQTVALVSLYLPIRHRLAAGVAEPGSVRQTLRDALAHRLPFETVKAVTDSTVPTDCAVTIATPAPPLGLPGATATPILTPTPTAHRPMDVILDIAGERPQLRMGYLVDHVPATAARRVLDHVAGELT